MVKSPSMKSNVGGWLGDRLMHPIVCPHQMAGKPAVRNCKLDKHAKKTLDYSRKRCTWRAGSAAMAAGVKGSSGTRFSAYRGNWSA